MSEEDDGTRDLVKENPPAVQILAIDQVVSTPPDSSAIKQMMKSGGLTEHHLSQALLDLKETGIRGNAMPFPLTIVLNLEMRLRRAEESLEYWRSLCEKERLKSAVLETQLAAERKVKILQNVFLTVGGLLNTLGVKLIYDKQTPTGLAMLGLGIALQIAGWLWPRGGSNKSK